MSEHFEEEELMVIAFFEGETRMETIHALQDILQFIQEDKEILPIVIFALEKLGKISDKDFKALELDLYKEEPEAEQT